MKKLLAILVCLTLSLGLFTAAVAQEPLLVVDGRPVKVVYLSNECASDWQAIGTSYLKALVEAEGGTCQIYNPENDAATQAQMLLDCLVLQPDVIVIKPIDAAAIVPAIQQVNAAGIPVILLDIGIIEGADVDILTIIQTNQESLGEVDAQYVGDYYATKGETAKVVMALGDMASTIGNQREQGFVKKAEELGNIEVIASTECKWDPTMAYNGVIDMLTAHPEANTIYNCADCQDSGIIQALQELDRLAPLGDEKHVTYVSIDADPSGCKFIQEGYIDQCAEHNAALHSDIAYKVIVDYIHGCEIPETIFFETTPVTAENVNDSARWGTKNVASVNEWGPMDTDAYVMQTIK
ncbi:MAG: sugar ABC transporter substrate-binding protein [Clostridia bacterium]